MPASLELEEEVKLLSVRMPAPEMRRLKSTAAQRGISMQEAVHQAVEAWLSPNQSRGIDALLALQGSWTGGEDIDTMRRREREFELAKDARWSR